MRISPSLRLLSTLGLGLIVGSAHAAFTTTTFSAAQWGASDATLGVSGYVIEDFEDINLVTGLQVSRLNGASGNFGPSSVLPADSVFDPSQDIDTSLTPSDSISAFKRGIWDGSHVLINHPGPATLFWYSDAANWKDLRFDFAPGVTSVGFSLQQMDHHGNRLLVNGVELVADLLGLMGADSEVQSVASGVFSFNSRHGYLRIDATNGDTIQSIVFDNLSGDGVAIDHLAFNAAPAPVPVPGALGLLATGLMPLLARRRRA